MLLFLQDLKGDNFKIDEKFTKLWVDNCPDFKTVPAHIIELNIRNCANFKHAPDTVEYLTVHNCPLYILPAHAKLITGAIENPSEALPSTNERGIKGWLKSLNETYPPDEMQQELILLEKKIKDLESQLSGKYGSENTRIRRFSNQPKEN